MSNFSLTIARLAPRAAAAAAAAAATAAVVLASSLPAQTSGAARATAPLDRRVIPPAGTTPALRVPTWTTTTLANGAKLVVSERHTLPLVSFRISFIGGAYQYEPAAKTGLGSLVVPMLSEGTSHRTGDQIANDLQSLGASTGSVIGSESGQIQLQCTTEKLEPSLAILSDMVMNSTYPQDALDRIRGRAIVNLTQNRDRTAGIASAVYPKLLYGTDSPYGRVATESSLQSVTRADVVAFAQSYFTPSHAVITVVGDITAARARALVEKYFGSWRGGGAAPVFDYPAPPAPKTTTIYLVDKPGAAQSTFSIGEVGPKRDTPDFFAIQVMNTLLGGMFQSRLNHEIREVKGYSYGVGSGFAFGRGPGPFRASGDIVTAKTDSALIEFMNELRDIRGPRPPSDDELAQAKANLVQSLPEAFEAVSGVNGSISSIYTQGLPDDYYQRFARAVNAVSKDDVVRVARTYIDPAHLTLLIVGDKAKIEAPLAATHIAPIVVLGVDGNPIPSKVTP